ncbi:MAG TPA: cytochrome c-type biogenesis protein CcmH [Bryobacteraceae bacterium]|nr:cytochrome c-type biogenesis protein CcmH [Bryobacteraceae bacterium]
MALAAGLCAAQTAVDLDSEPVNRVAKKMLCNCGCAQDMSCKMEPGCGICKRAKTQIFQMQQAGKTDSQILDQFVAENGKQILAVAPGLFGTSGPFIALSLGAILVVFVIRRYRKPQTAAAAPEIDPKVLDQINKDMAKLDE